MRAITIDDIELLREYRSAPSSRSYSLELQSLLTILRVGPTAKKTFIWIIGPDQYAIGQLGARRGDPFKVLDDRRFDTLREAQWALLKTRWLERSGLPWPSELDE